MRVIAKQPVRYKGNRYELGEKFEVDPTDFVLVEPYVENAQEKLNLTAQKKEKNANKGNVGNINRGNNEDTTATTKNID